MNKRSSDDKNQASLENQNKSTITTEQAIKFVSAEWTDEEIKLLVKGVKGILLFHCFKKFLFHFFSASKLYQMELEIGIYFFGI